VSDYRKLTANLFKYRPVDIDPTDGEGPLDWEDNWLSNGIAWISRALLPGWCQTPTHWTSRVANYLWAECPCCLFFRGFFLGAFIVGVLCSALIYFLLK
jgi:hypothetical protein